ncbi:MAG: hypothetical protein ACOX41_01580 [Anaerovoracaceae bacterium]|jgi:hypothetical protein
MINGLGKQLNMELTAEQIVDKSRLPLYLSVRTMYRIHGDGIEFVVVEIPDHSGFRIRQLKKQIELYKEYFSTNVAFSLEHISRYQREVLIGNGVPFVCLPDQIYLPFLGILLAKRFHENTEVNVDKLSPVAQTLFLLLAYGGENDRYSKTIAAKILGVTNTTITRASKQLNAIGVTLEETEGTKTYIRKAVQGADFFEAGKPYLIDPIQRIVYAREANDMWDLPEAGETALSGLSMLNPPAVKTRAIWKNDVKSKNYIMIDPELETEDDYIRLEEWKYSPKLFARDGKVDPISLYCTLRDDPDERIQGELEQVVENIKWL